MLPSNSESIGSNLFKTIVSLTIKIILSPLVILLVAYLYYEDTRKAFLIALLFYSILTLLSLLKTILAILFSVISFNLFKFIKKSFQAITMLLALLIYWLSYIYIWGTDFSI